MLSPSYRRVARNALRTIAVATATTCVTACATSTPPNATPPSIPIATHEPASPPAIPVIRYGRYTLIELVPDDGQRDLMQQVIDLAIPSAANATVGDALHYVLRRSGYRLCDERADTTAVLYALPLPAAHEHLGPITLHDALQRLAGPRWTLLVDDETREVCFAPQPGDHPTSPASSASSPDDPVPLMDADPINDPSGGPQ
ncbi:PilL N-terminal domain-containing protein [Burkholderia pseudomallei]|uniref:PFGI-1 class ICE element type IV pilus protein PilL2 n=1 Tax=Burkholderia pseudomallei TaxID=28450 RepID=UPI000F581FC0|nr:PilL N-terminal domain-containing protein [Burkholderia pseudomallei]MBM5580804.1 integrating conjugative element protein pill, pfgi-1 [Burkholderia pseudomallei]MBM5588853.1 integrating conjugative element protein pill, pfgi-1 [Burkholderia pseudomallei]RPA07144.1 integrating conjugative element protein pill, pfgi-1 [Burkholderia pseudomallei]